MMRIRTILASAFLSFKPYVTELLEIFSTVKMLAILFLCKTPLFLGIFFRDYWKKVEEEEGLFPRLTAAIRRRILKPKQKSDTVSI